MGAQDAQSFNHRLFADDIGGDVFVFVDEIDLVARLDGGDLFSVDEARLLQHGDRFFDDEAFSLTERDKFFIAFGKRHDRSVVFVFFPSVFTIHRGNPF